jgi:formylglycine-generating enzyme required for sulfatase activity
MKKMITATCLFAAAAAFADVATVSNVSIEQDALSRRVSVKYNLSAPAVVTLDIQTNRGDNVYASIGAKHVVTVWKDVNRRVTPAAEGQNEILWQPDKDWNGHKFTDANMVKAVVTAWADNATPDYMAVSLTIQSSVFYYVAAEAVPGGVTDSRYKTDWLLMRKIPAQGVTWRMGRAPADGSNDRDVPHIVQLSSDYYIGVYPVTYRQQMNIGYTPDNKGDNIGDMKPATASWHGLRGWDTDYTQWPVNESHAVYPSGIIAKFRSRTGIDFDLPTEAQWEFAARAGEGSLLYNGDSLTAENIARYAWINCESFQNVGQLEANKFGLYDCLGNVEELCMDWYQDSYLHSTCIPQITDASKTVVDPLGPSEKRSGDWTKPYVSMRVIRGGSYTSTDLSSIVLSWRNQYSAKSGEAIPQHVGYRLMAPMGGKW